MEPIVPLEAIQRRAQEAAAAGHCPHSACPWPPESAAAQAFHNQFSVQQVQQAAAPGRQEVSHAQT